MSHHELQLPYAAADTVVVAASSLLLLLLYSNMPGALIDSDDESEEEAEHDFGTAGSFKQSASMLYKANVSKTPRATMCNAQHAYVSISISPPVVCMLSTDN
jgi:hypothetical protein